MKRFAPSGPAINGIVKTQTNVDATKNIENQTMFFM